ncbi:hypothetical protein NMY22_g10972 [Coprinellus aureogranulatus]|nr:hypothetical protein NMY22_g10972 [Coprinellus aureogranulatus]
MLVLLLMLVLFLMPVLLLKTPRAPIAYNAWVQTPNQENPPLPSTFQDPHRPMPAGPSRLDFQRPVSQIRQAPGPSQPLSVLAKRAYDNAGLHSIMDPNFSPSTTPGSSKPGRVQGGAKPKASTSKKPRAKGALRMDTSATSDAPPPGKVIERPLAVKFADMFFGNEPVRLALGKGLKDDPEGNLVYDVSEDSVAVVEQAMVQEPAHGLVCGVECLSRKVTKNICSKYSDTIKYHYAISHLVDRPSIKSLLDNLGPTAPTESREAMDWVCDVVTTLCTSLISKRNLGARIALADFSITTRHMVLHALVRFLEKEFKESVTSFIYEDVFHLRERCTVALLGIFTPAVLRLCNPEMADCIDGSETEVQHAVGSSLETFSYSTGYIVREARPEYALDVKLMLKLPAVSTVSEHPSIPVVLIIPSLQPRQCLVACYFNTLSRYTAHTGPAPFPDLIIPTGVPATTYQPLRLFFAGFEGASINCLSKMLTRGVCLRIREIAKAYPELPGRLHDEQVKIAPGAPGDIVADMFVTTHAELHTLLTHMFGIGRLTHIETTRFFGDGLAQSSFRRAFVAAMEIAESLKTDPDRREEYAFIRGYFLEIFYEFFDLGGRYTSAARVANLADKLPLHPSQVGKMGYALVSER